MTPEVRELMRLVSTTSRFPAPEWIDELKAKATAAINAAASENSPSKADVLREVEQRIHDCYNMQKASAWPHCEGVARAKLIVRAMIEETERAANR